MGAVATLKQTAKSAADSLDKHQRSVGHQVQQQRQQTKAPTPPTGGFQPAHTAGCNAWDFHPLIGGLMDAVMAKTVAIMNAHNPVLSLAAATATINYLMIMPPQPSYPCRFAGDVPPAADGRHSNRRQHCRCLVTHHVNRAVCNYSQCSTVECITHDVVTSKRVLSLTLHGSSRSVQSHRQQRQNCR